LYEVPSQKGECAPSYDPDDGLFRKRAFLEHVTAHAITGNRFSETHVAPVLGTKPLRSGLSRPFGDRD
jgi:hypothetical protein